MAQSRTVAIQLPSSAMPLPPGAHQQEEELQTTSSHSHPLWKAPWKPKPGEQVLISGLHIYMSSTCIKPVPTEFHIQEELYLLGKELIQYLSCGADHLQMDGLGYFLRILFSWTLHWISATVSIRRWVFTISTHRVGSQLCRTHNICMLPLAKCCCKVKTFCGVSLWCNLAFDIPVSPNISSLFKLASVLCSLGSFRSHVWDPFFSLKIIKLHFWVSWDSDRVWEIQGR